MILRETLGKFRPNSFSRLFVFRENKRENLSFSLFHSNKIIYRPHMCMCGPIRLSFSHKFHVLPLIVACRRVILQQIHTRIIIIIIINKRTYSMNLHCKCDYVIIACFLIFINIFLYIYKKRHNDLNTYTQIDVYSVQTRNIFLIFSLRLRWRRAFVVPGGWLFYYATLNTRGEKCVYSL